MSSISGQRSGIGYLEHVRDVPQRAQNVLYTASDDLYVARNEPDGGMLGAKTLEAGTQSLPASSSSVSRLELVSSEDDEERDKSDTRIIFIGV